MAIRSLKIVFALLIALLCLFYAIQNTVNLQACYQAFAYALGAVDHQVYTQPIIPPVQSPVIIWLALIVVVGSEFLAGLLSVRGALAMWKSRNASAEEFNAAKQWALAGSGLGIVIWLGYFGVLGGGLFAMWQTEVGRGSLENAFQFFGSCALVFIILSLKDD